jgi:UTP--glucose-1-phosphate uridylyltransferase
MKITRTIIPAAGLGTRFFPLTKTLPKEMLPLLHKPAIQYVVEESIRAGIKDIVFITNRDRDTLMNYFDLAPELDIVLKERNKQEMLAGLNKIIRETTLTYIRQPEPLGLGHAILTAKHIIDPKEYISIILPDDIIMGTTPALAQLIEISLQEKASVIAVQEIPEEHLSSYGVIGIKKQITPRLYQVNQLIEKPKRGQEPSNLAVVGRYVLSGKICASLSELNNNATDELQLTDAISSMIKSNEKLFAYKIQGTRYDIGTPVGWLKAMIALGLEHPQYAPHVREFIATLDATHLSMLNPNKNIKHDTQ